MNDDAYTPGDVQGRHENRRLQELVQRHGRVLHAVAWRILNDERDARDAVRDAFRRHLGSATAQTGGTATLGLLRRHVIAAALEILEPIHTDGPFHESVPQFDDRGCRVGPAGSRRASVETLLRDRHFRRRIRASVRELPDGLRVVLLLRDIEGFSAVDAAAMLGISPSEVKRRLHRARMALNTLFARILEESEQRLTRPSP